MEIWSSRSHTTVCPADPIPLVMDSPHSGIQYPDDFNYSCSHADLRYCEDTHVDRLWSAAPKLGAYLLAANAPRAYIDCNRSLEDFDVGMVEGYWPAPVNPGLGTSRGFGLIWSNIAEGKPIYSRRLSVQEVQQRIREYYLPYHEALQTILDKMYDQFGGVWHLNQHSMPADAYARWGYTTDKKLADFVLGTLDGTTCSPEFVDVVEKLLVDRGYTVSINEPYKGMELLSRHGRPHENRHSLMIEINRCLYMDERTREPNSGFEQLQSDLEQVTRSLADYVRSKVAERRETAIAHV